MNFKEKLRFLITLKKIRQLAITGPHFSMTIPSFRENFVPLPVVFPAISAPTGICVYDPRKTYEITCANSVW